MAIVFSWNYHFVKSVCIQSYSGLHFPAFGLNSDQMRENANQNNSEYGDFLRSDTSYYYYYIILLQLLNIRSKFSGKLSPFNKKIEIL